MIEEVKIKVIGPYVYYLLECPAFIEQEVWGNVVHLVWHISDVEQRMFHHTCLLKLYSVCNKYGVKIKISWG